MAYSRKRKRSKSTKSTKSYKRRKGSKSRKSTYKKSTSSKTSRWKKRSRMTRGSLPKWARSRIQAIPRVSPTKFYDLAYSRVQVEPSTAPYIAFGATPTRYSSQFLATQYGGGQSVPSFSLSPMDLFSFLNGPAYEAIQSMLGTPVGEIGFSKMTIHGYDWTYRWTNASNHPVELECITLRARQDIPYVEDFNRASDPEAKNNVAYTWENRLNSTLVNQYYNTGTNNSQLIDYTQPAVKLMDSEWMKKMFKIAKVTRTTIYPGMTRRYHKFSKRMWVMNLAYYLNSGDSPTHKTSHGLRFAHPKGHYIYIWRPYPSAEFGTPHTPGPGSMVNSNVEPGFATLGCLVDMSYTLSVPQNDVQFAYATGTQLPVSVPVVLNPATGALVTPL